MAGKTKDMSQVKQLLLLKKEGVSNRKAAEIVGINKETANNYVRKALADRLGIDGLLKLDDPVLEHRLKGGNPAYTDSRFEVFKELLPYLQEEMRRKHVTLKLLWEEYVEEHPDDHYSLTQFRFHYSQNTEAKKESPSTVLADMRTGGEKLFLDFTGDTMGYIDLETGEMVQCQAFVATLPASDYGFLLFVPSQRTEDFVYAITQCLKHLGGVPRMLVPDNLKAAVVKTDRYEPSLNRVLEDMANHYGTVVVPARPVRPRDKSNVEGNVRLVYMRVFAELRNETFYSIDELNAAATDKMRKHNQKRMQKNPYTREERFLAIDRPNLSPLPATDFEIVSYTSLKVSTNCCIYLGRDQHYYSVPAYLQKGPRGLHTLARENLRGRGTRRNAPKRPCQRQVHHRGGAPCKQLERVQGTERRQVHRACQKGVQGTRRGDDAHLLRLQHASGDTLPHMRRPAQPAEKQRAGGLPYGLRDCPEAWTLQLQVHTLSCGKQMRGSGTGRQPSLPARA